MSGSSDASAIEPVEQVEVPPGQVGWAGACSLVNVESDVYIEARVRHEENLE